MEIYNRMLKTVVHPSQDPFSSCGLPKMLIKTPHRMPHEDGINYLLEQNITIYTADNFRTIIAKKSNEVTKSCVFYTQRLSISSSALVCSIDNFDSMYKVVYWQRLLNECAVISTVCKPKPFEEIIPHQLSTTWCCCRPLPVSSRTEHYAKYTNTANQEVSDTAK